MLAEVLGQVGPGQLPATHMASRSTPPPNQRDQDGTKWG